MSTRGIHGAVSSKALKRLKTIVDNQTLEELTTYYIRAYDETLDSVIHMNTKQELNKVASDKQNSNRPFFTDENGKAMRAVRSMQKANAETYLEDER